MSVLSNYLSDRPNGDFAKRIGISGAYLSQLASGIRKPSLDVAFAIERETGGQVSMQSWGEQIRPTCPATEQPKAAPVGPLLERAAK